MTSRDEHPSFLALDRLAVAERADPATQRHASGCAFCARYVAFIREGQDMPPPAFELRGQVRRWWTAMAAAALVCGAAPALVVGTRSASRAPDTAYTTSKGHPTVALYVKRGNRVFMWSSAEHVMPDDRLRLEIAADGFSYVTVLSNASGASIAQRPERLYEGALDPRKPTLLPVAWRVDDTPGDETLVVVLTRAPLDGPALSRALRGPATSDELWVERVLLAKPSDAGSP